jgi:hypothetical protein
MVKLLFPTFVKTIRNTFKSTLVLARPEVESVSVPVGLVKIVAAAIRTKNVVLTTPELGVRVSVEV